MAGRRYFVGIKIPDRLGEKLVRLKPLLEPEIAAKRWYGPEQFHITTNFLGELDDAGVDLAIRGLETVVPLFPKFELSLQGIGAFPNARVVWCGVSGETEQLAALQGALRQAFRPLGAEKFAHKKFSPHITLARTGAISSFVEDTVDTDAILDGGIWLVDEVCLFESLSGPDGARYPVVHRVLLQK